MNKKKLSILALVLMLVLTACSKKSSEDMLKSFEKKVTASKSYTLKGNMEILSNEQNYTYSLEASYLKDNNYKVTLVNQTNNHEQIILKSNNEVYVVTPALNKSFKFQSEWPDSSSQSYILSSLLKDIKNTKEAKLESKDNGYNIKTSVSYPNNKELTYQKIYFDKDMNLEKVEVYNNEDTIIIKVNFTSINLKAKLEKDDFKLDNLIDTTKEESKEEPKQDSKENCENEECDTRSSSTIESIIYPLYLPSKTYLSSSEKVNTDIGNRVILTFAGDKNFTLIEEVAKASNEFEIIPVYGDPVMLSDTIAAKSANSLYWTSDNISYYLTSNDLSSNEMVTIAESLGMTKTVSTVSGNK